jgi:hypothetical protein
MKEFFKCMFSASKLVSMMRVIVFWSWFNAIVILNYKVFIQPSQLTQYDTQLLLYLFGIPFGAKMGQSFAENIFIKGNDNETYNTGVPGNPPGTVL